MPQVIFQTITDNLCQFNESSFIEQVLIGIEKIKPQPDSILLKLAIPFFASLIGTTSAFLLNWLKENRKSQAEKNNALNKTIHLFSINMNRLLSFKKDFLNKFAEEFEVIGSHAGQYHPKLRGVELLIVQNEWAEVHYPKIKQLLKENENDPIYSRLNGLFKRKWDLLKCAEIDAKEIYFISGDNQQAKKNMPDVIRIALQAIEQTKSFESTLKERNELWNRAIPALEKDLWQATPEFMKYLYEFIDIRQAMTSYIDEAVVMMHAANICLMHYQKENFLKRAGLMRWLFGSHAWVRYDLTKDVRELMPDVENYKASLGCYYNLIKKGW